MLTLQPDPVDAVHCLWRHPHCSREEILAFQNERLRELVRHAYRNVPYYRRLFDQHGLKPEDIHTVHDLAAVPMTGKSDLQAMPVADMLARGQDPRRLIVHQTSGSTGQPHEIRRTWFEERLLNVFRWRTRLYYGQRPTDRCARIGLNEKHSSVHRLFQQIGLFRQTDIGCLQAPQEILRQLCACRPQIISGLSGAVTLVAGFMDEQTRRQVKPRHVAVGGEVLTPAMRRQICEGFGAPVYNRYGSHEFNLIAWECKETGELHTCDDGMIVEVLKDGRPAVAGERGEVVGTNLHAYAMPFIRFRLGDIVTKGADTCACGQPFSTIRDVQGRMIDYFPLPDGRLMHPYEIVEIILDVAPWIREYQLVQQRKDRVVLRAVPVASPVPADLARLESALAARLGPVVQFEIELATEIQRDASGKFRVSCSLVNSQYDRS
jgi:phenylacetate-CoA ligase